MHVHIPKLVPKRVRSGGRFTAPDPWNRNRRTDFTIEVYKMLPPESPPVTSVKDSWFWNGLPVFGIKSEIDGKERRLPESLVELWRTQRVPAEALPRLLWQMQSSLKPGDYQPTMRSNGLYWSAGVFALFFIAVVFAFASRLDSSDVIELTLAGMLIPLPVILIVGRRRARCRRQMDWVLTHL